MSDLISRKDLLDALKEEREDVEVTCDYIRGYCNGLTMARSIAIKAPSVEAEPKWVCRMKHTIPPYMIVVTKVSRF